MSELGSLFWARRIAAQDVPEAVPQVRCPTLVLHPRDKLDRPVRRGLRGCGAHSRRGVRAARYPNLLLLEAEPEWARFAAELEEFVPAAPARPAGTVGEVLEELTGRERDVLELIARGLDNSTIGARLGISERTARNHVSTIFSKLGAT